MGSMEKGFVHYCCVSKGGKILQAYSGGDHEIEKLAAACLERAPLFHRWYSQTMSGRIFLFLMEDGFIYFAIANEGIGNSALLRFLENVRNEYKKITKKGSSFLRKGGASNSNVNLQEQLVPVIRQLIASLQNVPQTGANGDGKSLNLSSSPHDAYYGGVVEVATSTKAPLLGKKPLKQDKKVKDHHMIAMRGIELEENRRSTDRDSDSNSAGATVSPMTLRKDMSASMRTRSQNMKRKWCRLVQLVLVIDVAICIILFLVWLLICEGLDCVR
ncbi:hypothetical protein BVRB_1g009770 [Beta vulgaris subsp. vulgaris]|nr:hypothetical protein BVRB_1g009770 [Beta vulgaris subsp. vulgaris]